MRAHIAASSAKKLIHLVEAKPANVHDSQFIRKLPHGEETKVWGYGAYAGQRDAIREVVPRAKDYTNIKGESPLPFGEGGEGKRPKEVKGENEG